MLNDIFSLSTLNKNESAVIVSLDNKGTLRRRLQDIGIIEGTKILCAGKSPLGDPKAYLIKGTVIAIRNADANKIRIRKLQ